MFINFCAPALIFQLKCNIEGNKHCYVHQVVFSCSDTLVKCISEGNKLCYVHQIVCLCCDTFSLNVSVMAIISAMFYQVVCLMALILSA